MFKLKAQNTIESQKMQANTEKVDKKKSWC